MAPRFGTVEIVFGTIVSIIVDIIALLLTPETLDVGNVVVHWLVWFIFVFWFHFKGVKGEVNLSKILKRLGIQVIPLTYTLSFLFVAWKTNHPKAVTAIVENAPEFVRKAEKAAGAAKKAGGMLGKLAKAV